MKNSEIIKRYWGKIIDAMVEGYRDSIKHEGRTESHIMVRPEDGDIRLDEYIHSSNSWRIKDDHVYIISVGEALFDWHDYATDDQTEEDVIEETTDYYRINCANDVLEMQLKNYLDQEKYEDIFKGDW